MKTATQEYDARAFENNEGMKSATVRLSLLFVDTRGLFDFSPLHV